jgi:exonuclease III
MYIKTQFTTINANGLADDDTRSKFFKWLLKDYNGVIFIQEAHSTDIEETLWQKQIGHQYKLYFSNYTSKSNGVVTILPNNLAEHVTYEWRDNEGRIHLLLLTINNVIYSLLNVYAPTQDKSKEQLSFFSKLEKIFENLNETVIISGGDFNTIFNPKLDKFKGGDNEIPIKAAKELINIMERNNLIDIWRVNNPNLKQYTWSRRTPKHISKSRLDYWIISDTLQYHCNKINIKIGYETDHQIVTMHVDNTQTQTKGKGYWKFNNLLINDNQYITHITKIIETTIAEYENSENKTLNWDTLKMVIRRETVSYSIRKAKEKRSHKKELEKTIENLENLIVITTDGDVKDLQDELDVNKTEWAGLVDEEMRGVIFRSKCNWIEHGEKSSKYFFSLEKHRNEIKNIQSLDINDKNITDQKEIQTHIENFYTKLYSDTTSPEHSNTEIDCDMEALLEDSDRDPLEAEVTIDEMYIALKELPLGKTPGCDGLTTEFYRKFWNILKKPLSECVKTIYKEGKLSLDQRSGIINLIPKTGKNLKLISNWRPITVLNLDYKIIAKSIANRIKPILPNIINKNQTGFMKNRLIGENIRIVQDTIDYTYLNDINGYLILLDFEKAFDSIKWSFIDRALDKFNFGPNIRKWIKILYTDINSSIINNGHLSQRIYPQRGIRQGCPLSAFLFIICAEILAIQIRTCEQIKGLNIQNKACKIIQFADDTAIIVEDWESIDQTFNILKEFQNTSGLKVNRSKSQIVTLGREETRPRNIQGMLWSKSFKYLGIYFEPISKDMEYKNFRHRLDNIRNLLKIWKMRDLSLRGKIIIIKNLAMAQLVYPMSYLDVSESVYTEAKNIFYDFLWSGKRGKVNYHTIIREINEGGLKMLDLDSMVKALKVKMLSKMIGEKDELWCNIPNQYFYPMNLSDFAFCRFKVEWIPPDVPTFYRQCLYAYSLIKNHLPTEPRDIQNEPIWFNANITKGKEPLFLSECYQKGIMVIGDLLDKSNKINMPDELNREFDLKNINFLDHYSIRKAIPTQWKKILENNPKVQFIKEKDHMYSYENNNICLSNSSTKNLYKVFINKVKGDDHPSNNYWIQKQLLDSKF